MKTQRLFAATALVAAAFAAWALAGLGLILVLVAAIISALLAFGERGHMAALGALYAGLPAVSLVWFHHAAAGFLAVLFLLLAVWATDTGAYFAGRLIGGRRGDVAGFVAALGVSADGLLTAFGRIVQYQTAVLLMSAAALWLCWRFYEGGAARRFLPAAALCAAVAVLAHYDGDITRANLSPRQREKLIAKYGAAASTDDADRSAADRDADAPAADEVLAARCPNCSYVYEVEAGDEHEGFPAGTAWADIPGDWCCPDCGVRDKVDFVPVARVDA